MMCLCFFFMLRVRNKSMHRKKSALTTKPLGPLGEERRPLGFAAYVACLPLLRQVSEWVNGILNIRASD